MQAVILIGIQATGKSSFYRQVFFRTHIRINMDMLKTRHREKLLVQACIEAKQPFIVDNTNPARDDRTRYIELARAAQFEIIGYYFRSMISEAIERNATRPPDERIPDTGIRGCAGRLEIPAYPEGFDRLYYVHIIEGQFIVEEWNDEI